MSLLMDEVTVLDFYNLELVDDVIYNKIHLLKNIFVKDDLGLNKSEVQNNILELLTLNEEFEEITGVALMTRIQLTKLK